MAVILKSAREVEHMRRAGSVVRQVLDVVRDTVKPGATTQDLENAAEAKHERTGRQGRIQGVSRVSGRAVHFDQSARSCTEFLPRSRVLKEGDIVSIDCGAIVDGFYGDSAITGRGGRKDRREDQVGS